jgi:hypothetical protein
VASPKWTKQDAQRSIRAAHVVGRDFPVSGVGAEVERRLADALEQERREADAARIRAASEWERAVERTLAAPRNQTSLGTKS